MSTAAATATAYQAPIPDTARLLSRLALVPFVGGMLLVWVVNAEAHPYATLALSSYAALMISFLGGVYWGIGLRQTAPAPSLFIWGIVPSAVAWVAVMMPARAGLVVSGAMLLVSYSVDRKLYPVQGLQRWLTLRFRLSMVAALCCFLGAAGA